MKFYFEVGTYLYIYPFINYNTMLKITGGYKINRYLRV